MSANLPVLPPNARAIADITRNRPARLAGATRHRNVTNIRVRQVVQFMPAIHRYPLTCGRVCVSPSRPPASFSRAPRSTDVAGVSPRHSAGHLRECRQLASPCNCSKRHRVTPRQSCAMLRFVKPRSKEAQSESSQTESFDHGFGGHTGRRPGTWQGRDAVAFGAFDGGTADTVAPYSLTHLKRFPVRPARWGRFVVPIKTRKDSICSTRS